MINNDNRLPDKLKLVLFSLAESIERQIQPNECVFELSEDRTKYQLRVIGGNPDIIAWATNDPNWQKLSSDYTSQSSHLIINARDDFLNWDLWHGSLRWLFSGQFYLEWSMIRPAINYTPIDEENGEISFELIPFGIATGGGCIKTEPMAGFRLVLSVLAVAAKKSIRKHIDKRTKEYKWLLSMGYVNESESH